MADQPFDEFMATTRPAAAAAYVTGDAAPVTAISTRHDPATFFGPGGGRVVGAAAVIETNEAGRDDVRARRRDPPRGAAPG